MPDYINNPQATQVNALYKGNTFAAVNNAASDSGVTTTQQVAIGPEPGSGGVTLNISNTTDQQAVGQTSWHDVDADYQNASGMIVPAGSTLAYNLSGGWLRFTFVSAPTSGSLIVSR